MEIHQARFTVLAGGVGAAKFVDGLARVVDPAHLTVIGNTADDIERHGLWISPDLDTMMYTLAGIADPERGWGIAGDTFQALAELRRWGTAAWFQIGDRDLATHLIRTTLRREGRSLTEITERLCRHLFVRTRILPVTDDVIWTEVSTPEGWMHFQEFFVRRACAPEILGVAYRGAERSAPAREVLVALREADVVFIAPSNPVASIGPILSVPGVRETLADLRAPRIAICPLIGGRSLKGPSDRMMRALGFESSVPGVAKFYRRLIDGLVFDRTDAAAQDAVRDAGIEPEITDTLMSSVEQKMNLARTALRVAERMHGHKHRHSRQESIRC